ncbi:hypothetical protein CHU98_g798 [Xylaria longipes]|nr:hypothetical protein CHU98_g798 [Xylaria longipes]
MHRHVLSLIRTVRKPTIAVCPHLRPATKHRIWSATIQRRGVASSGMSYVEGPKDPPLLGCTIPEHFASIVSRYGDLPAVIARSPVTMDASPPPTTSISKQMKPQTTLTYASLHALSNSVAHSLRSLGVKKGDRVAVSLGNTPELVVLTYAIFKLGAIWVPLNPSFNSAQLGAALSHLGVEVLIIGAVTDLAYKPCRGRSNLELLSSLIPGLTGEKRKGKGDKIESPVVPTLKTVVLVDNSAYHPQSGFPPSHHLGILTPYTTLLKPAPWRVMPDFPLSADETINIQFTSGTTSLPKAAMLSHTSVLNNGRLIASRMGLEPSDLIVCPPPLFHCFGGSPVPGMLLRSMAPSQVAAPTLTTRRSNEKEMGRGVKRTGLKSHTPLRLKEDVDDRKLLLDLAAHIIDVLQQAHISTYEFEVAVGAELSALVHNAIGGLLGPADDDDFRRAGISGKGLQTVFADTTGAAHEDGYETRGQRGRDTLIRGDAIREGDHFLLIRLCVLLGPHDSNTVQSRKYYLQLDLCSRKGHSRGHFHSQIARWKADAGYAACCLYASAKEAVEDFTSTMPK